MARIGEYICYSVSRFLLTRDLDVRSRELSRISESQEEFENWRDRVLQKSLEYLSFVPFEGKTVLDFGCGGGRLSRLLKERGAAKVYGVDLNSEILTEARKVNPYGSSVEFLVGAESAVPLPDTSIDLVFCLSVLEHVSDVDSILAEWFRILRPGGQVLIDWSAWHHPDASHLGSLIPIPYAQCIFSERTLSRTASRIKRSPFYRPKFWDYDENGRRQEAGPEERYTENFLNKMSIGQFNEKIRRMGLFRATHYECHPPSWLPQIRPLLRIPFFREHGSSFVTYVLTKPA